MKKPWLSLKGVVDYIKIALCIALCLSALSLFQNKDESVSVFSSDGPQAPGSFYGHLGSLI